MRWLKHPLVVIVLLACAAMLALLAVSPSWTAEHFARRIRHRIDTLQEASAVHEVRQLASYPNASLPHLVELLEDSRPLVREAARDTLRELVARWSARPTEESDQHVAHLAKVLAAHDPPRDLPSRVFVKLTAMNLLRWPGKSPKLNRVEFLADCAAVLQDTLDADVTQAAEKVAANAATESKLPSPRMPFDLPGGGLPIAPVEVPRQPIPSPTPDDPETPPVDTEPALLPRPEARPLPPNHFEPEAPRRIRSSEMSSVEPASAIDEAALKQMMTPSLMRHLHDVPAVAQATERELRRRGLNDATLKLARALHDPDPQVRRALVEAISKISDIDQAAWLWQLAEDDDRTVRQAALNILSTSNNPQTQQRAATLQNRDKRR